MHANCVAEMGRKKRQHRIEYCRIERCCCIIVEIDSVHNQSSNSIIVKPENNTDFFKLRSTPLYYFESKKVLFWELFQWLIEGIHGRMRENVLSIDDPVQMLSNNSIEPCGEI